jgi:hypothetical protein
MRASRSCGFFSDNSVMNWILEVGLVPILSDQFFANGTIHNINTNINM